MRRSVEAISDCLVETAGVTGSLGLFAGAVMAACGWPKGAAMVIIACAAFAVVTFVVAAIMGATVEVLDNRTYYREACKARVSRRPDVRGGVAPPVGNDRA